MNVSEQTLQQIERALRKAASKFTADADSLPLTDIHIQAKQEGGELRIYNDNDEELTRCVVEEWLGNTDEDFLDGVQGVLLRVIEDNRDWLRELNILKPYTFVLMDEDRETVTDLYLVDDDTIMISGELMHGLSDDLDAFWERLSREK